MGNESITIVNLEMIHVTKCEYIKTINDYGNMMIEGYIDESEYELCKYRIYSEECISVMESKYNNKEIVFTGLVKSVSFYGDREHKIRLFLQGMLARTDIYVHSRIFQNEKNAISDILNRVGMDYSLFYLLSGQDSYSIKHMVVQYEETDWNFMIRIISEIGGALIPDFKSRECKFHIGVKSESFETIIGDLIEINCLCYEYEKKISGGIEQSKEDQFEYVVKGTKIYELGEAVEIKGKQLYIYSIEGRWEGEELIHYYTLRSKGAFIQQSKTNFDLCGATFTAKVGNVINEKVEVTFDNIEAYGSRMYTYATVYSSENGVGWYCMPEINDTVTITFATESPESAYASGSVHLSMGNKDSNTKFIRNSHDKEIRFNQDSLTITNNKGTEIVLSDTDGLILKSADKISITAEKDILISSSEERISIQGEKGVELIKNNTKIVIDEEIMLVGEQVHIQNVE